MNAFLIALLGGIASGKSRVAALFEQLGARRLNADDMVHELLRSDDDVREQVREAFGDEVFDAEDAIDRRALAERVFPKPEKLKALEAILHPKVGARLLQEIQAISAAAEGRRPVIILDVPLAAEVGWTERADLRVFVEADEDTRTRRVIETRGWSAEDLRRREAQQMPLAEKQALAEETVRNSRSLEEATQDVRRIWRQRVEPRL